MVAQSQNWTGHCQKYRGNLTESLKSWSSCSASEPAPVTLPQQRGTCLHMSLTLSRHACHMQSKQWLPSAKKPSKDPAWEQDSQLHSYTAAQGHSWPQLSELRQYIPNHPQLHPDGEVIFKCAFLSTASQLTCPEQKLCLTRDLSLHLSPAAGDNQCDYEWLGYKYPHDQPARHLSRDSQFCPQCHQIDGSSRITH